jgi:hypothetical protein
MSSPTQTRPLGVAIIAVLMGILGFFILLGGILVLADITAASFLGAPSFFGASGLVLGLILFIFGLIVLAVAYGLYDLRIWALALAVIVLLIELVSYGLAGAFYSLGFILSLIILVYLLAVSSHFS